MSATTNGILLGKFEYRQLTGRAYASASIGSESIGAHWQTLSDGDFIVALNFGGLSMHFSPENAHAVGKMLLEVAASALIAQNTPSIEPAAQLDSIEVERAVA